MMMLYLYQKNDCMSSISVTNPIANAPMIMQMQRYKIFNKTEKIKGKDRKIKYPNTHVSISKTISFMRII